MATAEAIFKGSPAGFESAVRTYDRQLADQYGTPPGAVLIYNTSLIPGVPTRQDVAEVTVAISDLRLAEAASRGGSWDGASGVVLYWNWQATITAHALPGNRSRLFLRCEDAILPVVSEHWLDLLAELSRLGMIESGEPEPVATEAGGRAGIGPQKPSIEYRAKWVIELQKSGLSAELFVVSEAGQDFGHGPAQLRRFAKQPEVLAYIERNFHHSAETQ